MIASLNTPTTRITLAIALSTLLHFAIFWLPYIRLPQVKVELPPLTARLEPFMTPTEHPAAKPEPSHPLTNQGNRASDKIAAGKLSEMSRTDASLTAQPFPKHVQLTFAVHQGADGFMTGEIHHQLDIHEGRYTLKAVRQKAGLARLRNADQLIQISHGKIGEHGLQPDTFEQDEIAAGEKQIMQATFDWAAQKLSLFHDEAVLASDAQDVLSFMYQLSQLPMQAEFFPLPVTDGRQLELIQIEIGAKEDIMTPMGKLLTLHLRKMHSQREPYFEIWLGLEYRMLPVKFRVVDGSEKVTEEFVISDIRAAEE